MDKRISADMIAAKGHAEATLLRKRSVVGVDIGFKYVNGVRTGDLAIRVLVRKKQDVAAADAVPSLIDGFKTDVIEVGTIVPYVVKGLDATTPESATTTSPLVGGLSVGPCRSVDGLIYAGTLGLIVQKNLGQFYGLSNFHVLCIDTSWHKGDAITQPSLIDGGNCPADDIGTVDTACLATVYNCNGKSVDAALTTVGSGFSSTIAGIGSIGGSAEPTLGASVSKQGRTTGLTIGSIDGVGGTLTIPYDGIGSVTLTNQTTIVPDTELNVLFSFHGDSGSVIVDGENNAVGLLFAGSSPDNPGGYKTQSDVFVFSDPVFGDNMYFRGTDDKVWQVSLDGSVGTNPGGYKTHSNVFVFSDPVLGTQMYFRGTDDKVWRVNLDGSGGINPGGYKTHSDVLVFSDPVLGNQMYFRGTDDKVWRVNLDGSGGINPGGYKTHSDVLVFSDPVFGNNMYFRGTDDKVWQVSLDGTVGTNPGGYKTQSDVFVSGGQMFFRGTDDTVWQVNVDGSGGAPLGGYKTHSDVLVFAGSAYFRGTDNKVWRVAI
jgi:hypothetical protein